MLKDIVGSTAAEDRNRMWGNLPMDILAKILTYFPNDDHMDTLYSIWNMAAVNAHWRQSVLTTFYVFSASVPLQCATADAVRKFMKGLARFKFLYTLYFRQGLPQYDKTLPMQAVKKYIPGKSFQDRGINWYSEEQVLGCMLNLKRVLVEEDCLRRNDLEFIGEVAGGLRELKMLPCPYLRDYSPIGRLSYLTNLDVEFSIHQVLEVAGFCAAVSSLSSLQVLKMSRFPRLRSQHFIKFGNLIRLESLSFIECSFEVKEHSEAWFSTMEGCTCLKSITIVHGVTSDRLLLDHLDMLDENVRFSLIQSLKLFYIKSLRTLSVSRSVHHIRDVENLSRLVNLAALELENIRVQELDGIFPIIQHMTGIQTLKLGKFGGDRTPQSLRSLNSLRNLKILDLTRCGINDDCLAPIGRLPQLAELVLEQNLIQGSGIVHLVRLRNLKVLNLAKCKGRGYQSFFNGSSLRSLTKLHRLRKLHMGGSTFSNTRSDIDAVVSILKSAGMCVTILPSAYNSNAGGWAEWDNDAGHDWYSPIWSDDEDDWRAPSRFHYHPHNIHSSPREQGWDWGWGTISFVESEERTWDHFTSDDFYEDLEDKCMQKICCRKVFLQQPSKNITQGNRCFEKRIYNWRRSHGNKYYQDRFHPRSHLSSIP